MGRGDVFDFASDSGVKRHPKVAHLLSDSICLLLGEQLGRPSNDPLPHIHIVDRIVRDDTLEQPVCIKVERCHSIVVIAPPPREQANERDEGTNVAPCIVYLV